MEMPTHFTSCLQACTSLPLNSGPSQQGASCVEEAGQATHLVPLDAGAQLALLVPQREGEDPAARDALQGQLLVHALVQLVEDARHADEQRRLQRLQGRERSIVRDGLVTRGVKGRAQ